MDINKKIFKIYSYISDDIDLFNLKMLNWFSRLTRNNRSSYACCLYWIMNRLYFLPYHFGACIHNKEVIHKDFYSRNITIFYWIYYIPASKYIWAIMIPSTQNIRFIFIYECIIIILHMDKYSHNILRQNDIVHNRLVPFAPRYSC